jgi:Flp pilus assembly protein TadG
MNRLSRNSQGSTAIEFALVLPVLILLFFGIVEFGLLFYNQQIITNASREGARVGIVAGSPRPTDGDIQNVVTSYATDHLITFGGANGPEIQIEPSGDRTGAPFGQDLTVRVTYNYGFLVLANFGFTPINLEAQTVMKLE